MKILLLAPHPFFCERGTPIAVDLLLQNYSRKNAFVDVLTYHEGEDKTYKNVSLHRIKSTGVKNIRPGFSAKKIWCDFFFFAAASKMIKENKYDAIHAVEESVFMAQFFKSKKGIPYIYDMDSSMPLQIADKSIFLRPFLPLMKKMETSALKNALMVLPVCDELADIAKQAGARNIIILRDVSLLYKSSSITKANLRLSFNIKGPLFLYLGNLEPYQGIDLLLEAAYLVKNKISDAKVVIAGGSESDIKKYSKKASSLKLDDFVIFVGHKPLEQMSSLFEEADVLLSPRILGGNTPMKIYSYLESGKAILATNLSTHTQAMDDSSALLVPPDPQSFAEGMIKLAITPELRSKLGTTARKTAIEKYSLATYQKTFDQFYDTLTRYLQINK